MANETLLPGPSEIGSALSNLVPEDFFNDLSFLFTIAKAAGIVFLVYLLFLIIKTIVSTRQALRIKSIEKNLIEINHKLSLLVKDKKPTK